MSAMNPGVKVGPIHPVSPSKNLPTRIVLMFLPLDNGVSMRFGSTYQ